VAVLRPLLRGSLGAALALLAAGCRPKPACSPEDLKGCVINELDIEQDRHRELRKAQARKAGEDPEKDIGGDVGADDVKAAIATADSSFWVTEATVELLGEKGSLFFRYERYDPLVLERDLQRIERYYEKRGYYEARARAARVQRVGDSMVRVQIEIDEGPPTILVPASLHAATGKQLPTQPADVLLALMAAKSLLEEGKRFEEERFEEAKRRLARALTDRGYAYAEVTAHADVDRVSHRAVVRFTVDAGPRCTFGAIKIEGHGDLPEGPLRTAVSIEPGQPFSTEALDRAQLALGDIGVFGSVSIDVKRSEKGEEPLTAVPVSFVVQRAPLRKIQLGGGAELGSSVRAHLVSSWEHKNFLGDLRRLFVDAKAGVRLYPLQLVNWDAPEPGVRPLPEVRATADLKQPAFLESRTVGSARFQFKFFRPDTADSGVVSSALLYENAELHGTLGLERPFWGTRVRLGASVNVQYVTPVAMYAGPGEVLPRNFSWLLIPYFEANAVLDLRKGKDNKPDPINPFSGVYAAVNVQVAGIFPEEGVDLRIQPEVRAYTRVIGDIVLAFRGAGGFLVQTGYGDKLFETDRGNPCTGLPPEDPCNVQRARSLQIAQLRGFYSGGIDTNRGYTRNGVNPQEEVTALFDTQGQSAGVNQLSPIGGRWLWEAQLELRLPIWRSVGAALFADSGDVWYDNDIAFRPHLSLGVGARYMTPIGPLRADLGWRVPCMQRLGTCSELHPGVGGPPTIDIYPLNVSVAIGNAF
jgi:outer membrane protein assembly factor BamA